VDRQTDEADDKEHQRREVVELDAERNGKSPKRSHSMRRR
jgi:hypothetical protein